MAMDKGRAEFEQLMQKNRDTMMKNRGSKSPYKTIDAPVGVYFARIVRNPLGVVNMDKKNPDGSKSGFKEKTMQAKLQVSVVCSADPQCPPSELERWKGSAGFIQYNLPLGDDEATQRYYGDLEQIGIDTNGIVMTPNDIQDPDNQYTLGQVSDFLEETKPYCVIAIVAGKDPGSKFINYRGSAKQEDIEQLVGHELDTSADTVLTDEGEAPASEEYAAVEEAPFTDDTSSSEGTEEQPAEEAGDEANQAEWEQVGNLWHNKTDDTWFNEAGEQVEDPNAKKEPPKPKGPAFASKPAAKAPAKPSAPAAPSKPKIGGPTKPGSRK